MVAHNPKKKRNNSNQKKDELAKKDEAATVSPELALIEKNLGETLLTAANAPSKPTAQLIKGNQLLGLYFAGGW